MAGSRGTAIFNPGNLQSLLSLLHQNGFPAAVVSAVRTGLVGQFHLVTVRAFRQRRRLQMIMRSPAITPGFRMPSFRVRHKSLFLFWVGFTAPPRERRSERGFHTGGRGPTSKINRSRASFSGPYSPRSLAKGDSCPASLHWHFCRLRLAPQVGQSPRHSVRQTIFMGRNRFTCSATTSASSIPPPE